MSDWITVVPAYGRDYPNIKAVKAAWSAGLDFQETFSSSYINKSQAEKLDLKVIIRYNNLKKVVAVN